jgi:hypothetical protein
MTTIPMNTRILEPSETSLLLSTRRWRMFSSTSLLLKLWRTFLGALAKSRRAIIFVTSFRKENFGSHWTDLHEYYSKNLQWLGYCATNRKVAGSIPDGVIGIFHWHNPSDRTMALGSTHPLTEMSTRSISWGYSGRCLRLTTLPPSCAVVM